MLTASQPATAMRRRDLRPPPTRRRRAGSAAKRALPVDLSPILRRSPDRPAFPSYLDEPEIVKAWVWPIARGAALVLAAVVIGLLFVQPRAGLVLWWLWLLPSLPMVWLLAPGLWRNVCPMATLNQLPRWVGLTRNLRVPDWLARHAYLVQAVFYFTAIGSRAGYLDHDGPMLGWLMIASLVVPVAGGVLFTGKSGWCGTFCPLMPVQRLYGQTPAVVVKHTHCSTCVGCVKNCLDFNPRLAHRRDLNDEDKLWVSYRKIFAGTFPGFVIGFFTIPESAVGRPVSASYEPLRFFGLTLVYMVVSLGVFFLLEEVLPSVSTTMLTAVFGAVALNLHNVLRFTTTWNVQKPTAVMWAEYLGVLAVTLVFLNRTWRQEQRALTEEVSARIVGLPMPRVKDGPADSSARATTVSFDGNPCVTVDPGTTLLDAAQRSRAGVPAGCRAGLCGVDAVYVAEGASLLSPVTSPEDATLARLGLDRPGVRLACSARVHGEVRVATTIPADLPPSPPLDVPEGTSRPAAGPALPDTTTRPRPGRGSPAGSPAQRVVVVGNGVSGSTVVERLGERGDVDVTVVTAEIGPFYNRMGLTNLIAGVEGMDAVRLAPGAGSRASQVTALYNTWTSRIDRDANQLVLATGDAIDYDRLVLATGSKAVLPDLPGIRLPGVFVLRTLGDAAAIRAFAQIRGCRRATVLGAGLLGIEAAHSLTRFGLTTSLVVGGDRLLRGRLDQAASDLLAGHLENEGVRLVRGPKAVAVLGANRVEALRLENSEDLPTELLVVCVGSVPRVDLALHAGLAVGRGIVVDDAMRTTDKRIYAVGDAAEHRGQVYGLWAPATEMAETAAANILGEPSVWGPAPTYASILKDVGLDVTSVGRIEPHLGDDVIVDACRSSGRYRRLVLDRGVPVGGVVVGDQRQGAFLVEAVRTRLPLTEQDLAGWHNEPAPRAGQIPSAQPAATWQRDSAARPGLRAVP